MVTSFKTSTSIKSFFITLSTILKDLCLSVKYKYFPQEEYEITYTFNDTTRHCPKNPDDLTLMYVTIYEMFSEIKDLQLFKTLIMDMQYANMPSCKNWDNGNIMTLPSVMDAPFSNIITSAADRISTTYWLLKYKDDSVELIQPHQNRGVFRTGNQIVNINDKPDCMPDNVVSAIQVTIGVVQTSDNNLRGFQWKLYR